MTAACERVITIPELLASLVRFLSRTDLVRLARTNRTIYTNCSPLLWQSLDLLQDSSYSSRLLDSQEGLQALADNHDLVRAIAWGAEFSSHYFQALLVYLNITPALQSISTSALLHPDWGSMRNSAASSVTPLPPLLELERLRVRIPTIPYAKKIPGQPEIHPFDCHLHRNLWLARVNHQTLTYLDCEQLLLESPRVVRDLCRTISQLTHLRTLRLGAQPNFFIAEKREVLQAILFSCPASLVQLSLKFRHINRTNPPLAMDPVESDWDFHQGPLVMMTAPLLRLKSLTLPSMPNAQLVTVLQLFLKRCRTVEVLELPGLQRVVDGVSSVVTLMAELCRFTTDLLFPSTCDAQLLRLILNALPVGRLQSLYCKIANSKTVRMRAALTRHSATLRKIELTGHHYISSSMIQAVLTSCGGLETFRATRHKNHRSADSCLTLADAVEDEWVCARIRHLTINIKMMTVPQYLNDPSCATWTERDHSHWEHFGRLYAQIGRLVCLEVLDLKAIGWKGMPIGLGVDDVVRGKKAGHLAAWSGLNMLRELRGFYVWTQGDDWARIGVREADWFGSHLPALRLVMFSLLDDGEGYRMLRARRPWLKLRTGPSRWPSREF